MQTQKKILFIVNPISGRYRKETISAVIERTIDQSIFEHNIAFTQYAGHATELAESVLQKNYTAVVAVGGDGTINEIARVLINSNVALGILPSGSGNGLARHLGIPPKPVEAMQVINRFNIIPIDTGTINDKVFISVAGLGFDALIAEKFAKGRKRGFWNYFREAVSGYINYSVNHYDILADGINIKRNALLISFANSCQFGYNASLSPDASLTDGRIDLCIMQKTPAFKTFFLVPRLFTGNLNKSNHLEIIKIKEAEIICENPEKSHVDGDPSETLKIFKIKTSPLSLKIIIP